MKTEGEMPEFSLLGGPLLRLGHRLGLVREGTNAVRLGIALGLVAWGVLVILGLLQGIGGRMFSVAVIGAHVRLLVAIPLFFVCETVVAPRMAEFVRHIVRSGVVPESELPDLESAIRRVGRLKDSWVAEALFLVAVAAMPVIEIFVSLPGKTGDWTSLVGQTENRPLWVLGWYLGFCLPLVRFLLLRWAWHLGLWVYFLWRVARLDLRLIPTHSDGAAGLGYLEVVHEHFAPLALAISAVLSASFAEELSAGTMTFGALYYAVPLVLLLTAALFIGPLLVFSRRLWDCRATGLSEYMAMAARYTNAFDAKWVRDEKATGESQLGTADMQSLADLTNSMNVVYAMRWIPAGRRLAVALAVSVVVPLAPLLLMAYRWDQVAARLFEMLTG